ncbi:hypothetical protein NYR75_02905 [Actinobacillus equuli subsp. haemolyticus]|uniref:Uncharacterized protein n=1 Tax=Actinobacillus equuli subsp. equuli TaxID=202947 RepID=A0A9X4G5P9_ACTEU|nr:hypothetical protein [Actinobacillus equuli]MDE8034645.1 hypothetical protein [Actinobacillus equuli subsp. equuli]MDG4948716.1 hypothetical protein [Actinobacillus equuli subsp. haemolyticus]WGE63790.1 hypothetical protein NYR75_02905 [Actinobacillus equuli subsp. haemolyticus]
MFDKISKMLALLIFCLSGYFVSGVSEFMSFNWIILTGLSGVFLVFVLSPLISLIATVLSSLLNLVIRS